MPVQIGSLPQSKVPEHQRQQRQQHFALDSLVWGATSERLKSRKNYFSSSLQTILVDRGMWSL